MTKTKRTEKKSSLFPLSLISLILFSFLFLISTVKADTFLIDLSSQISIVPVTVEVSKDFNTTITIKNENHVGDTSLNGQYSTIKYHVPSDASYAGIYSGSGWSCDSALDSDNNLSCQYNQSLTNGQTSNPLTVTLAAPSNTGSYSGTVTVTATSTDANTSNDTSTAPVEFGKSNLHANKTVSDANVGLNQNFTYTIEVSNPYNGTNPTVKARSVTISDTLPAGIHFVSVSDTNWCSESDGTVTCSGSDLDVSNTRSATITVYATTSGTKTNTASVNTASSDYNNALPLTPSATNSVEPADIALTKTLLGGINADNAEVNSTVTYNISVKNLNQTTAQDVNFTDTLPDGVSYVGISAGNWNCNGTSTISCSIGNLTYLETQDVNITVKMPSTHQDVSNTATATTSTDEGGATKNNSDTLTTHVRGVNLKITKSGNLVTADVGSNYTYTVTVKNNGVVQAQNIIVTDTLDNRMTYVSDTESCSRNGQVLTCTHPLLDAGAKYNFNVTVTMPTDSLNDVTNSASVTNDIDEEDSSDNSITSTTHLRGPNLGITKDANVSEVGLGKAFIYTLGISSSNDINATNVNITDQLPAGVKITSIHSGSFDCPTDFPVTGTFHCTKTNFAGNATDTITLYAKAPTNSTGDKTNHVTIAQSLNSNDGSASKTVTVTGATLDISKSASSTAVVGGLIDYNITVTNTSHTDEENLTLTDNFSNLGKGYTLHSVIDPDGWTCSGTTTLTCTRASLLAEGATSTIHFDVNVPLNATLGTRTNQASVTTDTIPQPTETASANTVVEGSDIVVTTPTTTTAIANENVVFTVQVRNDGSATAKDVNLTNSFNTTGITKGNFTNIKIDCNNDGTYDITSSPYICQLGDITKNGVKTIKISATAPNYDSNFPNHTDITNNSTAATSSSESNTANNNKNWNIENHGSDLVIYKKSNTDKIAVDGTITYTISLFNQWEANATNINITDAILQTGSDGFKLKPATIHAGADWTCSDVTTLGFKCSYSGSLAKDQNTSDITIDATAPNDSSAIDESKDNEANVTTDTAEADITNNADIATVIVKGADLNISKSVSPTTAKLQQSVTYTIIIENNDLADAKNADVNDTLPDGFTNISTNNCDNDGDSVSGQSVHCALGDLAQGDSKTFTITANAPNTSGTYTNTAITGSDTPEANIANNTSSVDLIVKGADLRPHKAAPAKVAGNSTFTYTISLENIGVSTAYGAEINDTIPTNNGTTYVSNSLNTLDNDWTCSINGQNVHCYTTNPNLSIPNGYNHNIASFQVKAGPAHYWIHNTVVTGTNTSESNYTNNSYQANTEVIKIDLVARKLINGHNYGSNENYLAIGSDINYTLQVKNDSPVDINITDVNFTDVIPSNITNISISDGSRFTCDTSPMHMMMFSSVQGGDTLFCSMDDGTTTPLQKSDGWVTVATIAAKAIDTSNFDIHNENNNFITNKYKSETSLSDQHPNNNAPTGDDGYLHTNTLVRGANMSITKTASSHIVGAEHQFGYTLSVKNWPRNNSTNEHDRPSTTATNIVVKDTLPNDVNYTNASGNNWSCSESSHIITCTHNGTIAPGNTNAEPIYIDVKAPNSNEQTLTNEANVTNDTPELVGLLRDNNATAMVTTAGTNITVSKTGPATAGMSDTITYTITVDNNSTKADAQNIYVIDTFPTGTTYDGNISNSDWNSTVETNGNIRFTYDKDLLMSTHTQFSFSATLPHHTGIVRNHVEAFTSTVETSSPNKANWDTDIKGADLVFKNIPTQNPNPVGAYKHHEYNIIIHNQGLSPASDINVTVNLNDAGSDPGWSDVNGSGTDWNCDNYDSTNHKLICHLADLARSSDSSTLAISSTAPNYNGDITNSATVIGKDDTNTTTGETRSVTTTVKGSDLKITKYARDPDPNSDGLWHDNNITVGVGKEVDFKLSVSNINKGLAKNIIVKDMLPASFSHFSVASHGDWNCSFASNVLTCSRNSLDANSNAADIIYSATTSSSTGDVVNRADVNTTTKEVDLSNNHSAVNIQEVEGAALNTKFYSSKAQVALGEIFTYTLDVNNTGIDPAIDVNTTDMLPSGITYLDSNGSDSDWNCTFSSSTISCTQPNIPAYNGETSLKLNVQAPQDVIGIYPNDINITSNSIENPIDAVSPNVTVVGADLKVDINATPTNVLEDRNVTFNINVKDINISTAKNIVLKQTFSQPINGLLVTNGASDCNLTDANQSVTCTYSSLDYNQDKNITVVATMPNIDNNITMVGTVDVNTSTPQEDLVNHTASVNINVIPIKPVADYRFEECKWDHHHFDVNDSISGLNGKEYNGARPINYLLSKDKNHFSTKWRVGKFDGHNDYIKIPNNSKLQITHNQTICAWVRPTSFSNRKNIIAKAYGGEGTITQENTKENTNGDFTSLTYYYGTSGENGGRYQTFESSVVLKKNYWNHICLVRDLDNMKLKWYINNVKTNERDARFSRATASSNNLFIGKGDGDYTHDFKGYIDEVEIYNIALDDKAVKDIYNFEKNGKNYDGTNRPEKFCGVDLSVTKKVNRSPNVGAETDFAYTITVKNNSEEPLTTGFTLQDTMPNGLIINETNLSNADVTCTGDYDFNCTLLPGNLLKKGKTRTITIPVTAPNSTGETLINNATVRSGVATTGQPDPDMSNNDANVSVVTLGTDLKITKTASIDSNGSNIVSYNITVTNLSSLTPATGVTILDNYDSRLKVLSVPGTSCTDDQNNSRFTCTLPDIPTNSSISYKYLMIAQSGSGILNDINVSSHTVDTNLSNNHAEVSMDINVSGDQNITKLKDGFRQHVAINNYGNMIAIGNTILKANNNPDNNLSLTDINTSYVNVASQPLNSSSATLHIPENNVTIEYAGLYWGGHIKGKDANDSLTGSFNHVKLKTPSGNIYTVTGGDQEGGSITNDDNTTGFYRFKRYDTSIGRLYYSSEANITSILRSEYVSHGNVNGEFTISDLNVSSGLDNNASFIPDPNNAHNWSYFNSGFFGGWELVVIYSVDHRLYRSVRYKNSNIYDGFRLLMPRSPGQSVSLDINVTGFITPHVGDIESSLLSMVLAGDNTLPYESMSVSDASNNSHKVKEGTSNTDNIFNDTITLKNLNGSNIDKNLNLDYNPGVDLDQFDLTSKYTGGACTSTPCYLSNGQTATTIDLKVRENNISEGNNHQYKAQYAFVDMLGFNTQIFTPDFIDSYKECFKKKEPGSLTNHEWVPCSNPTPPIHRGTILKYRVTIINSGTDDAINVHVTDVLPKEVDFNGSCSSPKNYITATNIYGLPLDGNTNFPDYNSSSRAISGKCLSNLYDYNQTVRDDCVKDIKAILFDGGEATPLGTIPDGNGESMNLINTNYNGTNCSTDGNRTTLSFDYPSFPKKSVTWLEFNTTINNKTILGQSFKNLVSINFTNQTLLQAGINNLQTQESRPVDSGPVTFNWNDINVTARDEGRDTVGAKVVGAPFDLNITLAGISSEDQTDTNTSIYLSSLRIIDVYNGTNADIYPTVDNSNNGIPLSAGSYTWETNNTIYDKASRNLGFDMNITVKANDGNYSESKRYPYDFKPYNGTGSKHVNYNPNVPVQHASDGSVVYTGDHFSTRPKDFNITLPGTIHSGNFSIVKAGNAFTININAPDINGTNNSLDYNATLLKTANQSTTDINISSDTAYQMDHNATCINTDLSDLNISSLDFTNGLATSSLKYNNVGVVKVVLKDTSWTSIDQPNDCNSSSIGDNNSSNGHLISCSIDGNSTSIVFKPDHFTFAYTNISDHNGNFTYMVLNPISDQMYGTVTTTVQAKNAEGNTTSFFSKTCFAYDTNITLDYNATSKDLNDSNLSIASDSNTSIISSNNNLNTTGNTLLTQAFGSDFTNGSSTITLRMAMERNASKALQPVVIDAQNLKGSITRYLNIINANVNAGTGTDINSTGNLHFLFGRVHSPDYRFAGKSGKVKIYYEVYCKDCSQFYRNSMGIDGNESIDSINWYINTKHNSLNDGNVTNYKPVKDTNLSAYSSTAIHNGIETLTATAPSLPYIDKIDINATDWVTFDPKDFILEFQNNQKDWAGLGKLGHTVDTNVSERSNRRLNW